MLVLGPAAAASPGELLEMQILTPHPSATGSEIEAGLSIYVLMSPKRDSDVC